MPRSNIGRRTRNATQTISHRRSRNNDIQNELQRERRRNRNLLIDNLRPAIQMKCSAYSYDNVVDYSMHSYIGKMDVQCVHCKALKFKNEKPGMCCGGGKVQLPVLEPPPDPLHSLIYGKSPMSKHFLTNIQKYNSCFQMTSFGATNIIRDGFMPTFKIQGQIYHRLGSLLPLTDANHQFLQIYFVGDENRELNHRCAISSNTRREIVSDLQKLFHLHNELVKLFKTALDKMPTDNHKVIIKADRTPVGQHARRFNAPSIDEVAIVIVGEEFRSRDIVLLRRDAQVNRISELHRCYDALQYPILFWKGNDGYHINIPMINPETGQESTKTVSAMNFYSYRLMIRDQEDNHLLRCNKLFHQYIVDMYAKIESERLNFIRHNQARLRSEEYIHLRDAVLNDVDVNDIGRLTILPSSYIGSPRHMHEYMQDAMSYVRHYGRPDLFITFTCNPKWPEVHDNLLGDQVPTDRHDITARVFNQKLKKCMELIVKLQVFGEVRCHMYTIEWQKRGLPHAHILIWLVQKITPDMIDSVISAEIPDQTIDPELFTIVTKNMIHGPCGVINPNSPCMIDGKCSKRFPRKLIAETIHGDDGYPQYRRRSLKDNGKTTTIKIRNQEFVVNNSWIVPYSPLLSKIFNAHINVEYCNSVKSIKYICKYVNKGSDMAVFGVAADNNEILQYQMGRYISTNEAVWRILSFPIHDRHPVVIHLAVHLENGQRVYFTDANIAQRVGQPPATTLTGFFELCAKDEFARTLLYSEVPKYFTWNLSTKKFQRRKQGTPINDYPGVFSTEALGRIYTVSPNNVECFYLRLLLVNVHGPQSFQDLRTVNGELCATYRDACQRLNLLEGDSHWDATLHDASISSPPNQIRMLFAIVISTCFPSKPLELWDKYKDFMAEDILNRHRSMDPDLVFTLQMYNEALIMIEDICLMITNKTLGQFGMITPNRPMHELFERELQREQQFKSDDLRSFVRTHIPKLNVQQKNAYDRIMQAVINNTGELYFLDAPGGTGKTFLISLILATIRSEGKIALALASSGIAATLLDGGRTAHAALKLPLKMQMVDSPTCNVSRNSGMAKVLQQAAIILWDECTMANKKSLEALHRTLQDLRGNQELFGGALILLSGDFRQTLPIIPRSTPADEINACLKKSFLWQHVQKLSLNINMRVRHQNDPSAQEFSKQLLEIGDGKILCNLEGFITLPNNFCTLSSREEVIDRVFPNIAQNYNNHNWLRERAILAPTNAIVNEINFYIQEKLPGDLVSYKSIDTATNEEDAVNYPVEFLNSLEPSGMPPHRLNLKVGSSIILLRNLNSPTLCNGTRLSVKKLMSNLIEATILTGKAQGEVVLIPRIPLIPTDMAFEFKRLQFPVRLSFAITINKAQGQTLQVCGVNLEEPCFSHGQLYVACSRVGAPKNLFIYAPQNVTKNVVYSIVL